MTLKLLIISFLYHVTYLALFTTGFILVQLTVVIDSLGK